MDGSEDNTQSSRCLRTKDGTAFRQQSEKGDSWLRCPVISHHLGQGKANLGPASGWSHCVSDKTVKLHGNLHMPPQCFTPKSWGKTLNLFFPLLKLLKSSIRRPTQHHLVPIFFPLKKKKKFFFMWTIFKLFTEFVIILLLLFMSCVFCS